MNQSDVLNVLVQTLDTGRTRDSWVELFDDTGCHLGIVQVHSFVAELMLETDGDIMNTIRVSLMSENGAEYSVYVLLDQIQAWTWYDKE